tara:strand:- start:1115 stop:1219 length:105 start_codon:yes stop_codon:yes gene_type:complete
MGDESEMALPGSVLHLLEQFWIVEWQLPAGDTHT